MSAIDRVFEELRAAGRKAFMPFVTAGDPDLDFTAEVIEELAGRGANLIELGFPYSDPIADGPVIQASYTRALARHIKVSQILEMAARVCPRVKVPVVAMVSYAIVLRWGPEKFVEAARGAGLAGAIVPDLPADEAGDLARICKAKDFSLVELVTPTTPRERAVRIAETSTGFLYYVSVAGITGEREALPAKLQEDVGWLRQRTKLPICIGFGISRADHVRALAPVADGLIVGSAIVRRVAEAESGSRADVLRKIGDYAAELIAALPKATA
jgi:tryptophan synthase alpha chain